MFLTRSCESLGESVFGFSQTWFDTRMKTDFLAWKLVHLVQAKKLKNSYSPFGGDMGSNRRPPACKAGALPAELYPISLGLKTLRALKIKQRLLAMISSDLTLDVKSFSFKRFGLHRKEVIQPQVLLRLPCYDFTPVANPTFGSVLHAG